MIILFPEVAHEMPALGKEEITNTSTKRHRQEQPSIECHYNQHQDVGITDLHYVEGRLDQMHTKTDRIELQSAHLNSFIIDQATHIPPPGHTPIIRLHSHATRPCNEL